MDALSTKEKTNLPNRETTGQLIALFEDTCGKVNMPDIPDQKMGIIEGAKERVQPLIERFQSEAFSLVVVGEIKKGKSSLINALLEMGEVLPVSSHIATSTVFKLVYGEFRKNVVILRKTPKMNQYERDENHVSEEAILNSFEKAIDAGIALEEKEIADEEIALYGTEDGNPGNEKGVDHIRLEIPSPFLKQGLEIIDTPGLGGLMREHGEITWQYLPNAHAVLFVLESIQSPFTREESAYLQKINAINPLIFFAQTKIDAVDVTAWQSWLKRNKAEISKALAIPEKDIRYFPVSSVFKRRFLRKGAAENRQRNLQKSGFEPLEDFIGNQLVGTLENHACLGVIHAIHQETQAALRELGIIIEIYKVGSEENLAKLEKAYSEKLENVTHFYEEEFPDLLSDFHDGFRKLIAAGSEELKDFLHPGNYNPLVLKFIDGVRNLKENNPKEILSKIGELCSGFTDICATRAEEIYSHYLASINDHVNKSFRLLLDRLAEFHILEHEVPKPGGTKALVSLAYGKGNLPIVHPLGHHLRFSLWDEIRNCMISSSIGGALGLAVLSPFSTPVTVGGVILGSFMGSYFTSVNTKHRQTQQILAHFERALPGILAQLQKHYSRAFRERIVEWERHVRDEKKRIVRTIKKNITQHRREIKNLKQTARKEIDFKLRQLTAQRRHLNYLKTACIKAAGHN